MPSRDELIQVAGDALMDADCTSINDLSIEVADALLARWPHIAGPERVESVEVVVHAHNGDLIARTIDTREHLAIAHVGTCPWSRANDPYRLRERAAAFTALAERIEADCDPV